MKKGEAKTTGRETPRAWPGYVVAVGGTAIAVLVRQAILPFGGDLPLFTTFYPVVFAAAAAGGARPGLLATLLTALAADVIFTEPKGKLWLTSPGENLGLILFVAINVCASLAGGLLRKRTAALQDSESHLHLAHDVTRIGTFEWNLQTGVNRWTPELEAMYGLKPGQFGGTEEAWEALVHPEDRPKACASVERALKHFGTEEAEWRVVWPDGTVHWLVGRCRVVSSGAGRPLRLVGAHVDITARKNAEEALRERGRALARQARLIDLAPAATMVRRLDGTITFWSQGAERLYGWTKEEALGYCAGDLLGTEFSEPFESIVAKLRRGDTWTGELRHYARDGRQVVVESYWMAELNAKGDVEDLLESEELLESNTDITERKRLQEHLERLVTERTARLEERTAKLKEAVADLEHMSYSMVHDMRAPLRAMQCFAELVQDECAAGLQPRALDFLHRIRDSSNRLDRLITDALNYNKVVREDLPLTPVHLGKLLHGLVHTYPNLQASSADIAIDFDDVVVVGNESLLTQCFGNLLDNAVKFVAPGVKPRIRIWAEPSSLNQQPSTIIHTEDNGIGIPKQAHEKIFEMFQRMHGESEYPGTGIGLAIVRKAVERMSGRVGLESEPGKGTRISIELPCQAQAEQRLENAA